MINQSVNSMRIRHNCAGILLTVVTLLVGSQSCHAIDQCLTDGRVIYTDQPCPIGATVKSLIIHADPPNDPKAARQRYQSDLKQLRQIEAQQAAQQRQREADARIAAKVNETLALKAARCQRLESKKQWAKQQFNDRKKMAGLRQLEQALAQLRRAEEDYRLKCLSQQ